VPTTHTVFAFWNLNRQPLEALVARLARERDVHVLMLAESTIPPGLLLDHLNRGYSSLFTLHGPSSSIVQVYSRFPTTSVRSYRDGDRVGIRRLVPPIGQDIALAAAHLPSKLHRSPDAQGLYCANVVRAIEAAEISYGHSRTIFCGDFNMNPFEFGVVGATGFHAVMSRTIANRGSRTVDRKVRKFFYNPMWSLFGDNSTGPPGTYYYGSGDETDTYWHMFDQVLIRPSLLSGFTASDLSIVTAIGGNSLLTRNGLPNKRFASDHLPITFALTH
jgi:hypothetical protein